MSTLKPHTAPVFRLKVGRPTAGLPKEIDKVERCVISSFQIAESMGFKGEFRQWQELLRIGD
jgi:hypothetical protein